MNNTAPAQLITAPAQLITAPAQPPATGVVVYTALFLLRLSYSSTIATILTSVFASDIVFLLYGQK